VAIAGQAIIGRLLGAGDATTGRAMTWRMVRWGVVCGAVFGAAVLLLRPLYVGLFTRDVAVQHLVARVLVVVAVATVAAGVVYVLDGVLIGAGDGRYLAGAGAVALLAFVPMVWAVAHWDGGLRWLWIAYGGFILARMATLLVRASGTAWARVGAEV
jgi:Na+-driven multidrug efflux pump